MGFWSKVADWLTSGEVPDCPSCNGTGIPVREWQYEHVYWEGQVHRESWNKAVDACSAQLLERSEQFPSPGLVEREALTGPTIDFAQACLFAASQDVLKLKVSASGIAARSDETPQEAQPEGQEPGGEAETPKGDQP